MARKRFTVQEVAKLLGCSEQYVRVLLREGDLLGKKRRPGRRNSPWIIREVDLLKYDPEVFERDGNATIFTF